MKRVVVVGEVLCDLFAPRAGVALEDAAAYVPHLGGAPGNVAVQLARLGVPVALASCVGRDPLGARMRRTLAKEGVDTAHVAVDPTRRTGLTFVEVEADGSRRFFGWRQDAADLSIAPTQVELAMPGAWALVHGTVSLRAPQPRAATWRASAIARRAGALVCVDVNLRPGMYADKDEMLRRAHEATRRAHVVKASDEECVALYGSARIDAHVDALLEAGARLVLYTRGVNGAVLATRACRVRVPAPRVRVVDTTGAGDAFLGAALARLHAHGVTRRTLDALGRDMLQDVASFACDAAARSTTKLGATAAMVRLPTRRRSR